MRKALVLCLCFVLSSASSSFAMDTAKSLGMAGATVATADDLSAPYSNPAGLARFGKTALGLSLSSTTVKWTDDFTLNSSDTNIFENIGGAIPLGFGTIYAGSATIRSMFLDIEDLFGAGDDLSVKSKLYAPNISYGVKLLPSLAVGAGIAYLSKVDNLDYSFPGGDVNLDEAGTGLGAILGALYSPTPTLNLGASLFLSGKLTLIGTGDLRDVGGPKIDTSGSIDEPSLLRIGGALMPTEGMTVALEFDVMNGFSFDEKHTISSDSGDTDLTAHLTADTILATRLGLEYLVPIPSGFVALWAGLAFTPQNNFELSSASYVGSILDLGLDQYSIPNATTLALGIGHRTDTFDIGIAGQSTTGTMNNGGEKVNISETKLLISGALKI